MEKLTLPATLDALGKLRAYVQAAATAGGVDATKTYNLQLAVDEIATNIVTHGYEEQHRTGDLSIRGDIGDGALTITIEDHGVAFDPRSRALPREEDLSKPLEERQIGGLGIYLAVKGVDRFDYRREGDRNVNIFAVKIGKTP
jgi:anti-sigma regulatory factor (Ser/Thr protein kinase)